MNFSGKHFEFAGVSSSDPLGDGSVSLIFAHIDTEMNKQPFGYPEYSSVYSDRAGRRGLTGANRSESCLEFEQEIVSEKGGIPLSKLRQIEQWLFGREGFAKLYIAEAEEDAEDVQYISGAKKRLYLNCMLTEPEILTYAEGKVGWKVKVICDAPWAWQDDVSYAYSKTSQQATADASLNVLVDSDTSSYIYPNEVIIQMNMLSSSVTRTVRLYNTSDEASRITEFRLPGNISNIYILNNGTVVNSRSNGINLLPYMTQRNFPRLASYYTQNAIGLSGENAIEIRTATATTGVTSKVLTVAYSFNNRRFLT